MEVTKFRVDKSYTIKLSGDFLFDTHPEFRAAYKEALLVPKIEKIFVDLHDVTRIDSSALGMLLILRDKATAQKTSVTLLNPPATVWNVLQIANFNKLFNIS
jgi:anti-anti-sigma factor